MKGGNGVKETQLKDEMSFRNNGLQDERRGSMDCHNTANYKLTLARNIIILG